MIDVMTDPWSDQLAHRDKSDGGRSRKQPITLDRILDTAFHLVETEGFDALTMRRVAAALQTGPASLYAHVRNKVELDDLLIGRLCATVELPEPDVATWAAQLLDVCRQLRDRFLRYPGISRAALAAAPRSIDTMRINEGMLDILITGGVPPQSAAWTIDAAYLYVSAYCLESSMRAGGTGPADGRLNTDETTRRLRMLPANLFPNTVRYAPELTSGDAHERFDFTLNLMFQGLDSGATPHRRTST